MNKLSDDMTNPDKRFVELQIRYDQPDIYHIYKYQKLQQCYNLRAWPKDLSAKQSLSLIIASPSHEARSPPAISRGY